MISRILILSSCSLEFIVDLCRKFNTVIEIIDKSEEINEYDLLMDLKDMLSCHAKKLSSNKSGKAKKLFNNFIALALAPRVVSANNQFFLPVTYGRMAFSARLFEISIRPSNKKLLNGSF